MIQMTKVFSFIISISMILAGCSMSNQPDTNNLKNAINDIKDKVCFRIADCNVLIEKRRELVSMYDGSNDAYAKYLINQMKSDLNDLKYEKMGFPRRCATVDECVGSIREGKNLLANLTPPYADVSQIFRETNLRSMEKSIQILQDDLTSVRYRDELSKKPGAKIGMTAKQVIEETSWGKPSSVNRTTNAGGVREQWVYDEKNFLYFKNGILESIQN
jgi:hypothetical protein